MHPDFKDHSVQNLTNLDQRQLLIPITYYYWKISAFKILSSSSVNVQRALLY